MSLQALESIKALKTEARGVDAAVIRGRVGPVQKNVIQIEGRYRSDNHVRRQAGLSPDVARKSVTERWVEWFGAAAFERPESILKMQAFVETVFQSAEIGEPWVLPDYWALDEQAAVLLAKARRCHLSGEVAEERLTLIHLRGQVDLMLRLANTAAAINGNGKL